jgi:Cu-Zn family superoxide dismutase
MNTKNIFIIILFGISASPLFSQQNKVTENEQKCTLAICVLQPTQGNSTSGMVTFVQTSDGVKVTADIKNLSTGKHGFHIHECGDCSAPDGSSAKGHFNPESKSHGAPMDMMRHEGDLGNVIADSSGTAHFEYVDKTIMLFGNHSILGRSIIVHKSEDDLKTQPTGNAGARIACGVIGFKQ